MLGWIGYESNLERSTSHATAPQQTRASLQAWWDNETPSQDSEFIAQYSDAELTPWEKWRYRAEISRRLGSTKAQGPQINFIYRAGIHTFMYEAQQEKKAIRQDPALDEVERQAAVKGINTTIRSLRLQIKAADKKGGETEPGQAPLHPVAFVFIIVSECGAIEIMAIFIAAVLAFPTGIRAKLIGVVLGIPIMYFLNIFRLACLATLGAIDEGGQWFDFVHHYVWQSVYIIFVVFVWLAWIEFIVRRTPLR